MFYAHSLSGDESKENWHSLKDHLVATGNLAAVFAKSFGAENAATLAGYLHDLGKYSQKFQARLDGSSESVDHSTAGAQHVMSLGLTTYDRLMAELISYAIAGHHAGLADKTDLMRRLGQTIEPLDDVWKSSLSLDATSLWSGLKMHKPENKNDPKEVKKAVQACAFQLAFLGRMIFSCLVDADYKDTESFYAAHEQRIIDRDWPNLVSHIETLRAKFDQKLETLQSNAPKTDLNTLRQNILSHVRSHAADATGLFTLTVPTGGGKTLASLGFALDHAKAHGLKRIIYAIPFTSIIDQTAGIFRDVLGKDYILEHHSSIDEENNKDRQQRDKLKLAMEDWAAPVVVTTNVQLFESLFANRPSRCRKLHNLAESVIILDEAQTLPLGLLRPSIAALDELARNYGTSIVLCTATQPALDVRDFKHGGLVLEGRELAPAPSDLAKQLKRVTISKGHEFDDDQLVEALNDHPQALVIVNSRKHALSLYQKAKQSGLEGVIHLTTRQYAAHRREILAKVRDDLKDGKPCRLIATSLVEAGVDVDFPRVWRAEAGLDSIAQAAGRCNREGKRNVAESIVTVFKPKDHKPPREIEQLASDFSRMADKFDDLLSVEAMQTYFREVYWRKGPEQLDAKKILEQFDIGSGSTLFNYQTVAKDYRMIESGLSPVIINDNNKVQEVLEHLNWAEASPGKAARDLQNFVVQVPPKARDLMITNQHIKFYNPKLWGDQFAVLETKSFYRKDVGLVWENADYIGLENYLL